MTARPLEVRVRLLAEDRRAVLRLLAAVERLPGEWGDGWQLRPDLAVSEAPAVLRGHALVLAVTAIGNREVRAAGCAADPLDALSRALCEMRERHAAATFRPRCEIRVDSYAGLVATGRRAFDPAVLRGRPLRPERWPYPSWGSETVLPWIPGTDLADGRAVWLPLFLAGLHRDVPGGHLTEVTSIGLAAARTVEGAVLSARRELLERDRLVLAWRHGLPLRVANVRQDGEWTVTTLMGTTGGGYPLAAVVQATTAGGLLGIGSAANCNAADARVHAEAEAAQLATLAWLRRHRLAPSIPAANFTERVQPGRNVAAVLARLTAGAYPPATNAHAGPVNSDPEPEPAGPGMAAAVRLTALSESIAVSRVIAVDIEPMESADDCARSRPGSAPIHIDAHPFG